MANEAPPSPPYEYQRLRAHLFVGATRAILLGRFEGTPVGDFQEVWELEPVQGEMVLTRICVDNARRAEAGWKYWGMPKVLCDVSVSDGAARAEVVIGGQGRSYGIDVNGVEPAAESIGGGRLEFRCDASRSATLHLRNVSAWRHASLRIDGTPTVGRALFIDGAAVLGAPVQGALLAHAR